MNRKYWYVSQREDSWHVSEGWQVVHVTSKASHESKSDAVQEACSLAKIHCEITGTPTGVRVQGMDRRWWDEYSYGDE